ncbi:MAG: GIY-YIG nuclease family protein [Candidatus Kerfeldbacteria bacterium]
MYCLYIVRCADKTLYIGIAKDVKKRITEHNMSDLGARYTKARRPVKLVYQKKFRNRSTATRAEVKMKKLSRIEKLSLIKTAKL